MKRKISLEKKVRRIGFAFNIKGVPLQNERQDMYAEFDDPETIEAVVSSIESSGYEVVRLEADENFIDRIKKYTPDFVFNIAEGRHGECRESHVPAILEMLGIPYSGSGVLSQALTLTKDKKKEILDFYDIPTPSFQLFKSAKQNLHPSLNFPLIVKPNADGSSVGINANSVVANNEDLRKQVEYVLTTYRQSALVEEFCSGREFTLALLGNPPRVMPIVEITFDHLPESMPKIDGYESKWEYDTPETPAELECPADISPRLKSRLEKIAKKTFEVLQCVDFARIDVRLDQNETPNVLDVNALPGLMPNQRSNSRFTIACYAAGLSYQEIINSIISSAFKRYGLHQEK